MAATGGPLTFSVRILGCGPMPKTTLPTMSTEVRGSQGSARGSVGRIALGLRLRSLVAGLGAVEQLAVSTAKQQQGCDNHLCVNLPASLADALSAPAHPCPPRFAKEAQQGERPPHRQDQNVLWRKAYIFRHFCPRCPEQRLHPPGGQKDRTDRGPGVSP